MEGLAAWFAAHLGKYISAKAVVFLVSLMPILECRGVPIPFILLFIKKIFKWLEKFEPTKKVVRKLESRAMNKSDALEKGEFLGLMLFVGIPLPGTGGWTGSLLAALLDIDFKKALVAEIIGILIATVIMSIFSYGLLARIV